MSKIDYSLVEKYRNALNMHIDLVKPVIDRISFASGVIFPSENEAGKYLQILGMELLMEIHQR